MATDTAKPSALATLLVDEQLANARRVNVVRLWGVTAFLALFFVLGVVLGNPEWRGNLVFFAPYWAASALLYVLSQRVRAVNRLAGLSIAVLDVPLVFLLQWGQFATSPNVGAIAGFNLGIYVLLLVLAALALERWVIYATAASAAVFEVALQALAGISVGGMVSTLVVMGLAAAACAYGSRRLVRLIARTADAQSALARVSQEMEIASRIQTSILPATVALDGYDIAARMIPAERVGGDYYDIRPTAEGGWIGIGDVTGHGLNAGLIMLMIQTAVATLTADDPDAAPDVVVQRLNAFLVANIRDRLRADDYASLTLLRVRPDGRIAFAGRHEPIVVWRAAQRRCEVLETPGTWVGLKRDISRATVVAEAVLASGDILVLHTDGVTEAEGAGGERFGLPRIEEALAAWATSGATGALALRDHLLATLARWSTRTADDVTLVVVAKL